MKDFATYLVEHGAATHGEVLLAIHQQSQARLPIGRIALQVRALTGAQLFSVLAHQARHQPIRFGESAVSLGILTSHQVDELLLEQRRRTPALETFLVKAGVLDPEHAAALREAFEREPRSQPIPRPALKRAV